MTREEALAEVKRKQRSHPDVTWVATPRGDEWVVASIDVPRGTVKPTGTATKPPPTTPHESLQSPQERLNTLYGSGG
jgi:hypothetical protein